MAAYRVPRPLWFLALGVLLCGAAATSARADLLEAVEAGDLQAVRAALDAGEDPNPGPDADLGPLHYAVMFGHADIVGLLLKRGARVGEGDDIVDVAAGAGTAADLRILEMLLEAKAAPDRMGVNGWRPMHTAASKGRVGVVELLLKHGAKIEGLNRYGYTPLCTAAAYDKPEAVKVLLERDAKVDVRTSDGATPLRLAAWWNFRDVAGLLLAHGAPQDLFTAAGTGDVSTLERLLGGGTPVDTRAEGAQWDGSTALAWAAHAGREEALALLLARGADAGAASRTKTVPLHRAAIAGQAGAAKQLLAAGAPVDAPEDSGRTPLHYAATRGGAEVAAVLLEAGADPNAVYGSSHYAPLHEAALEGHADIVTLLLAKGASPAARTESEATPLHLGVLHADVVRALLVGGAKPDLVDDRGATALHEAAQGAYADSARLLIEAGASLKAKDRRGATPLHALCGKGMIDLFFGDLGGGDDAPSPEEQERETRRIAVAELMLAKGADPSAKDGRGRTALDLARENKLPRLAAFLEKRAP